MSTFFKKPYVVLLIFVFTLLVLIFSTYKDYGKTWDENDSIALGNHALSYYTSLGKNTSYFTFYPQRDFYLTRGPGIEMVRAEIMYVLNNHTSELYHLILALIAISGIIFMYLTMYSLTKKISLSLVGSVLLLTLPRFYGNMFIDSKDIAPLYLLVIGIYFALQFFSGKRNLMTLILLGLVFGFKASIRIVQIYAYPLFVIFAVIQELLVEKKKMRVVLQHQVIMGVAYFFALHVFQPYLITHPIFGIPKMIIASNQFPQVMPLLFNGKIYFSNLLRWYYLPEYFIITTPIITLILFAIGSWYIVLKKHTFTYVYVSMLFWIPMVYEIFANSILYDSWRHFFFIYAPFVIIATVGFDRFKIFFSKKWRFLPWIFLCVGLLFPLRDMILLHPYEYVYFNELTGGVKGAYGKFELDYWGESFKEATNRINLHKKEFAGPDGNLYISPCVHQIAQPFLQSGVHIDDGNPSLYYCINRPFFKNPGFYHVVYEVQREGAILNTIYKK